MMENNPTIELAFDCLANAISYKKKIKIYYNGNVNNYIVENSFFVLGINAHIQMVIIDFTKFFSESKTNNNSHYSNYLKEKKGLNSESINEYIDCFREYASHKFNISKDELICKEKRIFKFRNK